MSRIGKLAVVGAFFIAGTTFGQASLGKPIDAGVWRPTPSAVGAATPESFGPGDARGGETWLLFGSADYLLGRVKEDRPPVLVTTSPPGTAQVAAGVLGTNSTALFGGGRVNTDVRSGVRANLGAYLDAAGEFAVKVGFFGLDSASSSFQASSAGTPILARPFTNVTAGAGASVLVAFPGLSSGSIRAVDSANNLYGANFDIRERVYSASQFRVDASLGYRYLRYDEHIGVTNTIMPRSGPFAAGTSLTITDDFGARNIFNGVDLGVRGELDYEAFSLAAYGKVAVGVLERTAVISGSQVTSVPGTAAVTNAGGMLALASNSGTRSNRTQTGIPEVGLTVGYQITDNLRFTAGYSVLWWMSVVRPGDEIDTNVNPGLFPGNTQAAGTPSNPAFTNRASDLWVQTLAFGLEFRY